MRDREHFTSISELARLTCLECGTRSDEQARGWRAYIGGGHDDDPVEVGVYCPDCAAREFLAE